MPVSRKQSKKRSNRSTATPSNTRKVSSLKPKKAKAVTNARRRRPVARSIKKVSTVRRKRASASSDHTDMGVDAATYESWEQSVISNLDPAAKTKEAKALQAAAEVYKLQRLFIVFDGNTADWTAVDEKRNGRIFSLHNSNTGNVQTYLHRSPRSRGSVRLVNYVATDLRGVTHYTTANEQANWVDGTPTFTLTQSEFKKDGKAVKSAKVFATDILSAFFAAQKGLSPKSLKAENNPSKDGAVVQGLTDLLLSMQEIMNGDTVTVRLAFASFNANRTPNRTAPLRVFVPAKTVKKATGTYYVKERNPELRRVVTRVCHDKECDDKLMAVDVDDDKSVVPGAHLSINEPQLMIKYQACKQ